jgi:hypothetical protein
MSELTASLEYRATFITRLPNMKLLPQNLAARVLLLKATHLGQAVVVGAVLVWWLRSLKPKRSI